MPKQVTPTKNAGQGYEPSDRPSGSDARNPDTSGSSTPTPQPETGGAEAELNLRAATLARDLLHGAPTFAQATEWARRELDAYAATKGAERLPCGHHVSLLVKSVESDYQFCELCEARRERNDAVTMEAANQKRYEAALSKMRAIADALDNAGSVIGREWAFKIRAALEPPSGGEKKSSDSQQKNISS